MTPPRLALLLLGACAPKPPPPPPVAPPEPHASHAGAPVAGGLVLQGFDLVWDLRPHRLRRLQVGAIGTGAGEAAVTGQLRAGAQGGTWATGEKASDTPRVTVSYASVMAPGLAFVPARATLALQGRARGPDKVDIVPEGAVDVEIALPPGLTPVALTPWITGLDISTLPSHPDGYTPHAVAIDLGTPTVGTGAANVRVSARVEAAPVPDRAQKLDDYRATVVVDFVLVVAEAGAVQRVDGGAMLQRNVEPLASARRGPPFRIPLSAPLEPDTRSAIAGLTGFRVEVGREGPSNGRYLRALTVGLRDTRVDRQRGVWSADGDLRLSNAGELPRAARVEGDIAASVLMLPVDAVVESGLWRPDAGTGCAAYPGLEAVTCPADPGS